MSHILGDPGARVSRRSALRLGLAGAGLISGNMAAYGQMVYRPRPPCCYGGNILCPFAYLGSDPVTGTHIYYGVDCPEPPTQLFGIESPVELDFVDMACPEPGTECDDYDCTGCGTYSECPPCPPCPPCKTLPIPGKTLPIPGKQWPSTPTRHRKIIGKHNILSGNGTILHSHFVARDERNHYLEGLEHAAQGIFSLTSTGKKIPRAKSSGPATNYAVRNLSNVYVSLLLCEPTQDLKRRCPGAPKVGIGVQVEHPDPAPTAAINITRHGNSFAAYWIRPGDGQVFYILLKGR